VAWLGHSTVLLDFHGIRVLTDPALGDRIGVSLGVGTIGPKRLVAPALTVQNLPPIDVLLLSHAHMDHMDLPTLRSLGHSTFTISATRTRDLLMGTKLKPINELGWGERTVFQSPQGSLEIEAIEVRHWGQRWPNEMPRGYNGYILRREGKTVLFGGDTALTPAFRQLRSRGPFEIALMPIGAYRPWIRNHCTPEEAVTMANAAGAKYIVPLHHQTFRLSEEPASEPIERLQAALHQEPERLALHQIGQTFECPAA
jgi:L-ascorbate metabolism protein UlaG (beta-lactamase superfamily)